VLEREVGAHLLGVDLVALLLDLVLQPPLLPVGDLGGLGIDGAQGGEQLLVLAARGSPSAQILSMKSAAFCAERIILSSVM
jgi:hypothetical protein